MSTTLLIAVMPSVSRRRTSQRRAGADLDALDHPGRVTRAELGAIDPHVEPARRPAVTRFAADRPAGSVKRPLPEHGHLAGDAQVAQAIGPVAGHFQIDGPDRRSTSSVRSWFSPAIISRRSNSSAGMSRGTYS